MSCGKAPVKCLICGKKHMVKDVLEHVHEHVKYAPQKCNDCDFACIQQGDLIQHTYDNDHSGSQHVDPYKEWLVALITEDIQFAGKHGKDELLKRKNTPFVPTTPTASSTARSPPLRKQPPAPASPLSIDSPPPRRLPMSSSEDDDDPPPPKAAKKSVPEVPKRRSDNRPEPQRRQRDDSNGGESEEEDKEIRELRKANQRYSECKLCHAKVLITLDKRQAHIHDEHMDDVREGPAYKIQLEKRTKTAFPGLVWMDTQCSKCNKQNIIQTMAGRMSHVITFHYHTPLPCPKKGCIFRSVDPDKFKGHFEKEHHTLQWRRFLPEKEFHMALANHRSKLETMSRLIFTVDFPDGANSAKRKTSDPEEEDKHVLSQIYDAATIRPIPPPVAKRRRESKSVSSEEEDDSDDDKPASTTSSKNLKKEKEKIIRRDKNGELRQVDASDDEEEEEESEADRESKDDQMEMEEKRSGRASSASSTAATLSGKSNREDCKRDPSPEVKTEEEIKEEPMTPSSVRPRPVLLPTPPSGPPQEPSGWTGRKLPLEGVRELVPSSEDAASKRREEARLRQMNQRGRGRGGYGRGRGGGGGYDRGSGRAGFDRGSGRGGFDRGSGRSGFERGSGGFNLGGGSERRGGRTHRLL